jgi:Amt family ammonium transporter
MVSPEVFFSKRDVMKSHTLIAALAAAAAAFALPAMAQDTAEVVAEAAAVVAPAEASTHTVFILNTLLFLIGGFLVMWMAAGFAMLEAGLVRTKNVAMQCTKNIALFSVAGVMYYVCGYQIMYPGDAWIMDGVFAFNMFATMEPVGVSPDAVGDISYASTASDFFFQLMFCATTASIVSGTLAERIKLWPFMVFTIVLTGLIYPIQGSWKWGGGFLGNDADGGFMMSTFGAAFQDFAGSTLVHSVGGWAALVGALILGPRIGKYRKEGGVQPMPGSNLTLATLGTFILWLGWFGFNGASQLAMGTVSDVADVSRIFANTNLAAAGGAIAAMIMTQLLYGKVDLTMLLNGALAGLVSITAEPLAPSIGLSIIIGAIGGVLVVLAVPMLDKLKIDDVVGAIPVHLVCGVWGTLAVVLSNDSSSLGGQLFGIVVIAVFVIVASLIAWMVINAAMGLRCTPEEEMEGLDSAELGLEAYPEFGKGSQFA